MCELASRRAASSTALAALHPVLWRHSEAHSGAGVARVSVVLAESVRGCALPRVRRQAGEPDGPPAARERRAHPVPQSLLECARVQAVPLAASSAPVPGARPARRAACADGLDGGPERRAAPAELQPVAHSQRAHPAAATTIEQKGVAVALPHAGRVGRAAQPHARHTFQPRGAHPPERCQSQSHTRLLCQLQLVHFVLVGSDQLGRRQRQLGRSEQRRVQLVPLPGAAIHPAGAAEPHADQHEAPGGVPVPPARAVRDQPAEELASRRLRAQCPPALLSHSARPAVASSAAATHLCACFQLARAYLHCHRARRFSADYLVGSAALVARRPLGGWRLRARL